VLNKLAETLKNLRPSDTSRKSGMDAAMAAFDAEFAHDTITQTGSAQDTVEQKNTNLAQGSADAPRLTGQNTGTIQ